MISELLRFFGFSRSVDTAIYGRCEVCDAELESGESEVLECGHRACSKCAYRHAINRFAWIRTACANCLEGWRTRP
jgi:hypothetical protein